MKRSRCHISLLVALTFLVISSVNAQKEPHFELYNISHGLSTMEVQALFQDSQGYLWIGLSNGVNRYNGYDFEQITLDTSAAGGLGNINVFSFFEDNHGWVWMGTNNGVFIYTPESGLASHYPINKDAQPENDFVLGFFQESDSAYILSAGFPAEDLIRFNPFSRKMSPIQLNSLKNLKPADLNLASQIKSFEPGKAWIAHFNYGLLVYTTQSGQMTQILPRDNNGNEFHFTRIWDIIRRPGESEMWIGDITGVYKYNPKTNKLIKKFDLKYRKIGNPRAYYNSFSLDADGNIWISARNYGLYVIRAEDEKLIHYPPNKESTHYLADNFINNILIDKFNIMWLGNETRGLLKYDMNREPIHLLKNDPSNSNSLAGSYIFSIYEDPIENDIIWIGTNETGINRLDRNTMLIKNYQSVQADPRTMTLNSIRSIYRMPDGKFWLGTWGSGVDLMDKNLRKIKNYRFAEQEGLNDDFVRVIKGDSHGNVWFGTLNSLFRYIAAEDRMIKIESSYTSTYPNDVFTAISSSAKKIEPIAALTQIGDNADTTKVFKTKGGKYLIIGLGEGVAAEKALLDYGWLENSKGDTIWSMYHTESTYYGGGAPKNRMRIGLLALSGGDYKLRFKSDDSHSYGLYNEVAPYDTLLWGIQVIPVDVNLWSKLADYTDFPDQDRMLKGGNISHIIASGDKVWISTQSNGLTLYDYNKDQFTNYEHTPGNRKFSQVKHFAIDGYGIIWEATTNGLVRFDYKSGQYKVFTVEDGLPANFIESIVIDDQGDIWLATQNGMCRFVYDRSTEKVTTVNYGFKDGLQGGSFVFNAGIKTNRGEVYFGGTNGLNYFMPPKRNNQPPKIILSKLSINGRKVDGNEEDSPLTTTLPKATEIDLEYFQNNIEVEFIALHYARPYRNQYKHRLIGFNENWTKSERRFANYTNLAPGDYTFEVTGSNGDGVWNEEGISLKIHISPPWWQTIPAYISYFLIFALMVFAIDRFQRHRILKREREKTALMEAELRAQAAEAQAKIVQAENDRKTKELEEARALQLSLLPTAVPVYPNVEISTYMKTATEVGGDYYDFAIHKDGSLIVAIGDATGHGLKAGTLVTAMKSLFTTNSPNMVVSEFYESANQGLKKMHIERVLMGFAIMKINDGKVQILNAGMPPIMHYHRESGKIDEIKLHGMPLGAMEGTKFEKTEITAKPGDTFLMMSDGLPELRNREEEMFGYERTLAQFEKVANKSTEEIVKHFKEAGSVWVDDEVPEDDVTLVAVKLT